MNRKIILWSFALFVGSGLLFHAIAAATSHSSRGITVAIQAAALVAIVGTVVLIVRRGE